MPIAQSFRLVELMEAHVPVLWGAHKPVARSENETKLLQAAFGPYSWAGMWQPESPGACSACSLWESTGRPLICALMSHTSRSHFTALAA
jgi:hypothetical protein